PARRSHRGPRGGARTATGAARTCLAVRQGRDRAHARTHPRRWHPHHDGRTRRRRAVRTRSRPGTGGIGAATESGMPETAGAARRRCHRMSDATVDAVVIGAGPNGLTAAAVLADAGWDVLVLEEQPEPGGAVRSAELHPGYCADLFSAFYPLGVASPAFQALDLASHGLRWVRSPKAFGHPLGPDDEDAIVVSPDPTDTAADLERRYVGDGEAWLALFDQWKQVRGALLELLLGPFPPVRGSVDLLRTMKTGDLLRYARMLALPVTRMSAELFGGSAAR